jgi:hypothetical protein
MTRRAARLAARMLWQVLDATLGRVRIILVIFVLGHICTMDAKVG